MGRFTSPRRTSKSVRFFFSRVNVYGTGCSTAVCSTAVCSIAVCSTDVCSLLLTVTYTLFYSPPDMLHHIVRNCPCAVNQKDSRGFTPLHRAAYLAQYDGYLELYEYLLSEGADPSLLSEDYDPYLNPGKKTPVEVAIKDGPTRDALLALNEKYSLTTKTPVPHADIGDWWALYDYGPEAVYAWPADHKPNYPERRRNEKGACCISQIPPTVLTIVQSNYSYTLRNTDTFLAKIQSANRETRVEAETQSGAGRRDRGGGCETGKKRNADFADGGVDRVRWCFCGSNCLSIRDGWYRRLRDGYPKRLVLQNRVSLPWPGFASGGNAEKRFVLTRGQGDVRQSS